MSLSQSPAFAATIVVNTTSDELNADGDCSLREAIQAANTNAAVSGCTAGSGADTITVPAGTYALSIAGAGEDVNATGDLDVTGNLTINGAGAATTIIDGSDLDRVLHVVGDYVLNISALTVRNGDHIGGGGNGGGGIFAPYYSSSLVISNSVITSNTTTAYGGGIRSDGALTLSDSTVSANGALNGGGIIAGGLLTVSGSTISGNTSTQPGGGIEYFGGPNGSLMISNSTISGNSANAGGGVHAVIDGVFTITSSTITGNSASADAGLSANLFPFATVSLKNTIIADNSGSECGGGGGPGGITSAGNNLSSDSSCGFTAAGDQQNANPLLGPLAGNGGPTQTHALLPGSPAIDAGSNDCPPPAADQRGVARAQGAACDIGAFELQPGGGNTPLGSNVTVNLPGGITATCSQVTGAGNTTVASGINVQPPPDTFIINGLSGVPFHDITTTATCAGQWTVCFHYDESQIRPPLEEGQLRLYHFDGSNWADITVYPVDLTNNIICGRSNTLSPFVMGIPGPGSAVGGIAGLLGGDEPPGSPAADGQGNHIWLMPVGAAVAAAIACAGWYMRRRRRSSLPDANRRGR